MRLVRTLGAVALALVGLKGGPLRGQAPADDPVLLARAQRAAAKGIPEDDLPPVPRSIVEPPPLPPPELHPRDQRGSRAARAARKGGKATPAKSTRKGRPARKRTKRAR